MITGQSKIYHRNYHWKSFISLCLSNVAYNPYRHGGTSLMRTNSRAIVPSHRKSSVFSTTRLLHLSLLTSTYQISPTIAQWADSIIFIHLEGFAHLSSTRNSRLHRQASLHPRHSVTLSIQHITQYRIRLTAAQPVLTLMFAALRSDVVTKYLKRVPTFPPFVTINCLKFGVRGPPVNNRPQNDASRFSP